MWDRSDAERLLDGLANDFTGKLRAVALDADDETKLERATAIVDETSAPVIALVFVALFASLHEYEQRIATLEGRLAGAGKRFEQGTFEN